MSEKTWNKGKYRKLILSYKLKKQRDCCKTSKKGEQQPRFLF